MRRQWPWVSILGLTAFAGVALSWAFDSDRAQAKEEDDDKVAELMETVHEYPISPWPMAKAASQKEPVDWETLNAALPKLEKMSKALADTKNKEVRELADGYIGAVKALGASAGKKDVAGTRAAIMMLSKSCVDCHFKDGPAGELEDE